MTEKLEDRHYKEIVPSVYWLGYPDSEAGFTNNPYLIVDGNESVLIDPGPGHPLFRDIVTLKIQQICSPESIRYIVVHHPGAEICGIIPYIENYLHPDVVILCHPSTALFIPYFGIRCAVFPVGDGDRLQLSSGRMLQFLHMPYLTSPFNMPTYDAQNKILFSSVIFGSIDRTWRLYAEREHLEYAAEYMKKYMGSRDALLYAQSCFSKLDIDWILPQHGAVIRKELVPEFIDMLGTVQPGGMLEGLGENLSAEHRAEFIKVFKDVLKDEAGEYPLDADLSIIAALVSRRHSTILQELVPRIYAKSVELGIQNPLTHNRIYTGESLKNVRQSKLISTMRTKMVNAQYALGDTAFVHIGQNDHQLMASEEKMAIMFIDIRKFTAWCENNSPENVESRLSYQYETISRIVGKYSGRINKIMGDGVLAYFPETMLNQCLFAALHIQMTIAKQRHLLPVGIGIDFGKVIIGDLGEHTRLDFTVIGRTVNHAARMCSLAGPGEIAMNSVFFDYLSASVRGKIEALASFVRSSGKIKPSDPELPAVIFASAELEPVLSGKLKI